MSPTGCKHTMSKLSSLLLLLSLTSYAPAQGFKPNLGPDLPTVTVTCDDVTILLRQESQWTPGRIDFRGTPMTTTSSAYGTVFRYPEVGFIGTAHLENEPENLQSLSFILDGEELAEPQATLKGKSFRFVRESKIRGLRLTNVVEVKDNRLYETTTVVADVETPLSLVYHFMHAWTPTVSMLLAGNNDQPDDDILQPLLDKKDVDRKFYINRAVDWLSAYEPNSKQFAVSRLLQAPEASESESKLWNVPGTYRKYYLIALQNQTVAKGFTGTWRMVTAFGHSDIEQWQTAARDIARELSE